MWNFAAGIPPLIFDAHFWRVVGLQPVLAFEVDPEAVRVNEGRPERLDEVVLGQNPVAVEAEH